MVCLNSCREEKGEVVTKGEVYIYQQVIDLRDRKDRLFRSITLPDCRNMHIFEINIYDYRFRISIRLH